MTLERTPTDAERVNFRTADFSTLTEALDYAATGRTGANFYSARGELLTVQSYRDLRDEAKSLARRMIRAGLSAGERVALVAETDADFLRAFFACQYAALIAVPLPLPTAFGGRAGYIDHIRLMLAGAGAAALLSPVPFLEMIREAAKPFAFKTVGTYQAFDDLAEDGADLRADLERGFPAMITERAVSGSTRPKAEGPA